MAAGAMEDLSVAGSVVAIASDAGTAVAGGVVSVVAAVSLLSQSEEYISMVIQIRVM